MKVLNVRNVEHALLSGLALLAFEGVVEESRVGRVLVAPTPVTTRYSHPTERVLFSPVRDANPFFHLMESLWMLAGRNDIAFISQFAAQVGAYTDDGTTMPGAYGHRWISHFGYDQLSIIIEELKKNPTSRRCVLAMWDADMWDYQEGKFLSDLGKAVSGGKDVPCNTHAYFRVHNDGLEMTVCNRSNDIVWGAYGANAVHFSMMQEYVASAIGCPVGAYYQMSNNYHAYIDRPDVTRMFETKKLEIEFKYDNGDVFIHPLMTTSRESWGIDLERFMSDDLGDLLYKDPFFTEVAVPMRTAHMLFRQGDLGSAIAKLQDSKIDWLVAGFEWLQRRAARRAANTTQGAKA